LDVTEIDGEFDVMFNALDAVDYGKFFRPLKVVSFIDFQ